MKEKQVKKTSPKIAKFYDDVLNTRIRELLERNNISTKDFAQKLNVSTEAIRLWISGYARPDINKIIEISNIFNVSTDYLLGKTSSTSLDYDYQITKEKFGISDKSMTKLAQVVNNLGLEDNELKLKLINYIIEDDSFLINLTFNLKNFYRANENKNIMKDEIKEKFNISSLDISRYALIKLFENFIDDTYVEFWKSNQGKLFDIKKK